MMILLHIVIVILKLLNYYNIVELYLYLWQTNINMDMYSYC